ncbi:DinB family protein [Arthrobacter castelli]|uniref:DinB family protein n=1 Tax=Arthrobacter castelli TaxID=271431 RepID=UPI00047D09EC|nr:DinB family protein [Arthrobacter castelli]
MDRCGECGFEYDLPNAPNAPALITKGAAEFDAILQDSGTDMRSRREPTQWSPLEYGCHVRDMLLVQRERVLAARRRHRPSFDPMGRDERVDHDGYAEQQPVDVAGQLTMAAQLFVNVLTRLSPEDWDRRVVYNYPRQAQRSLRWVAIHTVHEVNHHLLDVRRQLA